VGDPAGSVTFSLDELAVVIEDLMRIADAFWPLATR
jgi:hypothetical protein